MPWLRSLRSPYVWGNGATYLKGHQKRWAQVHDVRLLATHQIPDSIIERYKDKLSQKAKLSEYNLPPNILILQIWLMSLLGKVSVT